MKRRAFAIFVFLSCATIAFSRQGMWPPILLGQQMRIMTEMGLQLELSQLYHPDSSALNHAVVQFGTGCTGGIISPDGLVATNFHCSHRQVQALSTLENNLLKTGFWATDRQHELPVPGLNITITQKIEELTEQVLAGTDTLTDSNRAAYLKNKISELEKTIVVGPGQKASIKPFYSNNRYFLIITETFRDIRLAGVPPESIGRFGGDTDNWMWPRHTGDFSLFRIYANAINQPAEYSSENLPYRPKTYLRVNLSGIQQGDFTMVYGFPGTTQFYLPSMAIDLVANYSDPLKIAIRDFKIDAITEAISCDSVAAFRYSAMLAYLSNSWKKWQGEIKGIRRSDAIKQKQDDEQYFRLWIQNDQKLQQKYGQILERFDSLYQLFKPYQLAYDGFTEAIYRGQDSYMLFSELNKLQKKDSLIKDLKIPWLGLMYGNHTPEVERASFLGMMNYYIEHLPEELAISTELTELLKPEPVVALKQMFDASPLTDLKKIERLRWISRNGKLHAKISNDKLFLFYQALNTHFYTSINRRYHQLQDEINQVQALYTEAQVERLGDQSLFPDANSTLRISYGQVEGYRPSDGIDYSHYTTLDGILEKVSPHVADYQIPERLRTLYEQREFGPYADQDGKLHTCFIASNHTTGGNSGSPVLNSRGELIGLNFDRCWEGTMSDLWYNPQICRNIALDIRYMLFLIDRFGEAGYLLNEMTIME